MLNVMEHVMTVFWSEHTTETDGPAEHVQSGESTEQPVHLVRTLHHLHHPLPISWCPGSDGVTISWMLNWLFRTWFYILMVEFGVFNSLD